MADVEVRENFPARLRPRAPDVSIALLHTSRQAAERLWPTAKSFLRPLGIYLASRLLVYAAISTIMILHFGAVGWHFTGPWPANPHARPLFEALGMWDGAWYLHIASHGYETAATSPYAPAAAFLPVLPIVIKATAFVTGLRALHAGILAVFVIGAAASVAVWLLVRHLCDVPTADRATALWCFFPGAMTLSLIYSEGLLVVLAVVCLFALMRQRWLVAGIAALLAGATAPEGLALFACCAWAAGAALVRPLRTTSVGGVSSLRGSGDGGDIMVDQLPVAPDRRRWLAPLAPLLAPMGFLAYMAFLWRRTGDPTYWYAIENRLWHGGFDPWAATLGRVHLAIDHPGSPDALVPTLMLAVLVVAAILLWRWRPPAVVSIYAAVTIAFVLSSGALGARPRFLIAAFPFIVALARPVKGLSFQILLSVSAGVLALLTLVIVAASNPAVSFVP